MQLEFIPLAYSITGRLSRLRQNMAKTLITVGVIFVVLGLCWPLLQKLNLGRLPGDFVFKSGNFKLYFPLTTCLVISLVLSILFWFFRK